jgi:hypothetical protein
LQNGLLPIFSQIRKVTHTLNGKIKGHHIAICVVGCFLMASPTQSNWKMRSKEILDKDNGLLYGEYVLNRNLVRS